MQTYLRPVAALSAAFLVTSGLTGCAQSTDAESCLAPITGSIQYYSSSVPPPGHYEWVATIDDDKADLLVSPGYDSPEHWEAPFRPDQDALVKWCNESVEQANDRELRVGSGSLRADLTTADGKKVTSYIGAEVSQPIGLVIPEQKFDELFTQFEQWQKEQM